MPEFIELFGVIFLPHTYPLVFGVPIILIILTIGGAIGGHIIDSKERNKL
jgi:hypothetical protein